MHSTRRTAACRRQPRLSPLAKYILAAAGLAALIGLTIYLALAGRSQAALASALCLVAVAVALACARPAARQP